MIPRCWKCRHQSEPFQIWQKKASKRWRAQRKEQDDFERKFQDEYYDDEGDRIEIDYSEAYL